MKNKTISDNDLKMFFKWHKSRFNKDSVNCSVLSVCMCGYFHILPRESKWLIERSEKMDLIKVVKRDILLI